MSQDQSWRPEDPTEHLPHAEEVAPALPEEPEWLRLDKRKLLLDPVSALKQSIVPVVAVLIGASSSDNLWWVIAAPVVAAVIALFGLVPWFTTFYRITPTQLQLRKGLFNKTTSTAPLDRIRSVDLEATLLHRLLGMRKVQIGTGVDDERIELDAVTIARAEELRNLLLSVRRAAPTVSPPPASPGPELHAHAPGGSEPDTAGSAAQAPVEPEQPERVLAVFNWSWVRFAPFNLARLAVIAAAVGALSQLFGEISIDAAEIADSAESVLRVGVLVLTVLLVVGLVIAWLAISVIGYVVQWWGLRLTRAHGSLNLTSGLLTTRSISVEEKRIRGVELTEPLLMRVVNGAGLSTLATGVGEGGTTSILPHCPTPVATDVASDVLGDAHPMRVHLAQHGPAARRRRHVAFQWMTWILLALGLVGHWVVLPMTDATGELWWFLVPGLLWLPLGVVLAELSYAHLGHALTDDHLVVGHGATARRRTALEVDGIIGWVFEQSFFQRRLGLVTLQATTAAGPERVTLLDVPEEVAVWLAAAATREPVRPFLDR